MYDQNERPRAGDRLVEYRYGTNGPISGPGVVCIGLDSRTCHPGGMPDHRAKWLALRPEERWWLYSKTSSEAGLADQMLKGWRKALYCALSDGSAIRVGPKISPKVKKQEEQENMRLFDLMKGTV